MWKMPALFSSGLFQDCSPVQSLPKVKRLKELDIASDLLNFNTFKVETKHPHHALFCQIDVYLQFSIQEHHKKLS